MLTEIWDFRLSLCLIVQQEIRIILLAKSLHKHLTGIVKPSNLMHIGDSVFLFQTNTWRAGDAFLQLFSSVDEF